MGCWPGGEQQSPSGHQTPPVLVDPSCAPARQDPHLRPNLTAVVDMLDEVVAAGSGNTVDLLYWGQRPQAQ